MKSFILFVFAVPCVVASHAQESGKVRINTQESVLLKGCLYPAFEYGKVIYKDGSYGKAQLNYNCVTQEMLFINNGGDTLKVANPEKTLMVTIASDTFTFFKNTFLQKITHNGDAVNLYQKLDLQHIDNEKKQAYGYSSVTGDGASTTFVNSMGGTNYLEVDQNLVYVRSGDIYITNEKGNLQPFKLTTLQKMFPAYKSKITAFSKTNKTDWKERADGIKMMDYIETLSVAEPSGDH